MPAKYTHTNLIAKDWRRLAAFYVEVFGCVPVPPERNHSGKWLEKGTGVKDAHITGIHLRLPGYGETGPTLEIFSYDSMPRHPKMAPNTPGFAHLAFAVDDIKDVVAAVLERGGKAVGAYTAREVPGVGLLSFQYVADPEGNILEIQNWKKPRM